MNGLVNLNDQLVNEYRYTPFGMPVNGYPVQGTANPLQYMAREADAATGLYYVRNRWYDPHMGRFVSEDPIGLAGGINQYAYVENIPTMTRDPFGLSPECSVGNLPSTDPHFGNVYWTFQHGDRMWWGQSIGSVVILCPGEGPRGSGAEGGVGSPGSRGNGGGAGIRPSFCRRGVSGGGRPDGVDLQANIAFAEWSRGNIAIAPRLQLFRALVTYGGPWDYKTQGEKYEPFGNWHYGVTGSAMGFPKQVLLRAAGWAQQQYATSDPSWGNPWDLRPPYGDEPADQSNINRGINDYERRCAR